MPVRQFVKFTLQAPLGRGVEAVIGANAKKVGYGGIDVGNRWN